jgi:hypothetical protein
MPKYLHYTAELLDHGDDNKYKKIIADKTERVEIIGKIINISNYLKVITSDDLKEIDESKHIDKVNAFLNNKEYKTNDVYKKILELNIEIPFGDEDIRKSLQIIRDNIKKKFNSQSTEKNKFDEIKKI